MHGSTGRNAFRVEAHRLEREAHGWERARDAEARVMRETGCTKAEAKRAVQAQRQGERDRHYRMLKEMATM
jgi:hypothetical protein